MIIRIQLLITLFFFISTAYCETNIEQKTDKSIQKIQPHIEDKSVTPLSTSLNNKKKNENTRSNSWPPLKRSTGFVPSEKINADSSVPFPVDI